MLSMDSNDILTRVGPGTPMGELMREYWIPACLPQELAPDATPMRLKLLGEKLIAFRDSSGRIGILDHRCPHRCASMFFGRNEEGGIRCAYHGWKFDVEGNCLDMPNIPEDQRFTERVKAKAYKVAELGGMVWVYMGKREVPPPLPALEVFGLPESERIVHVPPARLQLAAVTRRRHRHLAFRLPACRCREVRRRRSQHHAPLGPDRPRAALPCEGDRLGHDVHGLSPGRSRQTTSIASPTSCSRASRWCRTAPSAT